MAAKGLFLTEEDLKNSIKNPSGGYFLVGREDFAKEKYIKKLRKTIIPDETFASFNEITFTDLNLDASAVSDAIASQPMMNVFFLVTIKIGTYPFYKKKEEHTKLLEALNSLEDNPQTIVIVSVYDGGFDTKKPESVMKSLSKCYKFYDLPYYSDPTLVKSVTNSFAKQSVSISQEAAFHMIEVCGRSIGLLTNEIDKVACACKSRGENEVSSEIIDEYCASFTETADFQLANALADGNIEKALEVIKESKGRKTEAVSLMYQITSAIQDMCTVSHLLESGLKADEIAARMGMNNYRLRKMLPGVKKFRPAQLDNALEYCLKTDEQLKSENRFDKDGYGLIERFICSFVRQR